MGRPRARPHQHGRPGQQRDGEGHRRAPSTCSRAASAGQARSRRIPPVAALSADTTVGLLARDDRGTPSVVPALSAATGGMRRDRAWAALAALLQVDDGALR